VADWSFLFAEFEFDGQEEEVSGLSNAHLSVAKE
jgi:hypothetical protein